MPDIHYAVIHTPGSAWKVGVAAREQPGLGDHVDYYRGLVKAGKLKVGGPFADDASGGIMVFESSVSEAEARRLAEDDPAAKAGLLDYQVRPWAWVFVK